MQEQERELNEWERRFIEDLICIHLSNLLRGFLSGTVEAEKLVDDVVTVIRVAHKLDLSMEKVLPDVRWLLETVAEKAAERLSEERRERG